MSGPSPSVVFGFALEPLVSSLNSGLGTRNGDGSHCWNPLRRNKVQSRDRFMAAILVVHVLISSAIAYGASAPAAGDADWNKIVDAGKKEGKEIGRASCRERV